jgi:hypothetical protein
MVFPAGLDDLFVYLFGLVFDYLLVCLRILKVRGGRASAYGVIAGSQTVLFLQERDEDLSQCGALTSSGATRRRSRVENIADFRLRWVTGSAVISRAAISYVPERLDSDMFALNCPI